MRVSEKASHKCENSSVRKYCRIGYPVRGVGPLVLLDTGVQNKMIQDPKLPRASARRRLDGVTMYVYVSRQPMCMSPGSLESKEVAIQNYIVSEKNSHPPPTQTSTPGAHTDPNCPTEDIIGDFMTKPLQGKVFEKFRKLIMGHE